MKKLLTYFALVLLTLTFSSCSDYLDIKPRGYDVPHKLSHYEGLIYGADLSSIFVYHYGTFEHTIDEPGFSSLYSLEGYNASKAYLWQPDIFRADDECYEWNMPCSHFYRLNLIVDEVMDAEDGTDAQKISVQSEARFMRAWFTFLMAQYFGDHYNEATAATDLCVPIITEASTTGTEFERETVQKVYDYIITEMEESLEYLPKRPSHTKRIFNGAGNAMLGKVYWMIGDYEKALPYLEEAMTIFGNDNTVNLNDLALLIDTDAGQIWDYPISANNPESIFVIQTMTNLWTALATMMGNAHRTLRPDVLHEYFDDYDMRLSLFTGVETWMTAYAMFSTDVRYHTNMTIMTANDGISLPDVYLMYAETLARTGDINKAKEVLTNLRSKRMPIANAAIPLSVANQDEVIQFVVAERIRENFGTGLTWYDMRRLWDDPLFQDLKQYYTRTDGTDTYTLTKERLTMKLPPSVMKWNPDFKQN